ncbi:hypothetical protein ACFL4W_02725 [Planctomycetota bacterium]
MRPPRRPRRLTAAPAAPADTQAEGPQEPASEPETGAEDTPEEDAGEGPSTSARNILTYESNTKRNLIIAGAAVAVLALVGIIVWFMMRVTPEDRFNALVKDEIQIIGKEGYDYYFNKLWEIEKVAGEALKEKVKARIAFTETKVDDSAEEDMAEARLLADNLDFEGARERLALAEERSKKTKHIKTIRALREEYAAQHKQLGTKLSKTKAGLATKLAQAEESPGRASLVAFCLALFRADTEFKTFPQWKSDRTTFIAKLNTTVLYETERILKEDYDKTLSETPNLAKVEKELSELTGDQRVKPFLTKNFLADVHKKIKLIKSKAHGEYTDIDKIKDKEKFEGLEKKIKEFKGRYPWFADIEKVNAILEAVNAAVNTNETAYKKAMGLYAVPNTDEYKVAIEEFQKVSKRYKDHGKAVYYIEFLTSLIDTLKGWREASKRTQVINDLMELGQRLRVKLEPAEREVIDFWVEYLANIDQFSNDEYNRVEKKFPDIQEEGDLKTVMKELEEIIRKFPESEGVKKAKTKIAEVNQVVADAKVISGKIDSLIAEEKYQDARTRKEKFLEENPVWAGIYLKPIPIFVVPYPVDATVKVNGKVTKIIDFKDKDEANVEVSAEGFETLRLVSQKSRDKTQELVILNRKQSVKTEIKEKISTDLVATDKGIICTYKSGVNLYGLDGKLIWDQSNLELIVGERKGIWLVPTFNAAMKQIYVLGEKKMHVINATTGAKITEDNLGVNPETSLAVKTDPLIGNRFYLYFGTFSREIVCLNADTLKRQWDGLKLEDVPIDVIVNKAFDNWLVVACKDAAGNIYVVDFRNGFVEKKKAMGAPIILPLVVHDKKVYAALETGVITSLDPKTGASWQSAKLTVAANEKISDFDIIQNKLYITIRGSLASRIVILDLNKQGENVGEFKAVRPVFTDLIQTITYDGDQTLYFTTKGDTEQDSGIWAWDLKTEEVKWQYFVPGLELYPPLIIQGKVYAVSKTGTLYAFE